MDKKVIIFDFDGTIADSFPVVFDIINDFAEKEGTKKFSESQLRNLSASLILKEIKISKIKIFFFLKKLREKINEKISFIKPIRGIAPNIRILKKNGNKLGIVTSNSSNNVKEFLKNNDLDIFDFVYSDSSIFGKDKIIKKLLKKYDIKTKNALYVGDEIRDVEAARKAGIKIVAVSWGFNSKKTLIENNPDYIIDNPNELLSIK